MANAGMKSPLEVSARQLIQVLAIGSQPEERRIQSEPVT
jgi:hypothetical protein